MRFSCSLPVSSTHVLFWKEWPDALVSLCSTTSGPARSAKCSGDVSMIGLQRRFLQDQNKWLDLWLLTDEWRRASVGWFCGSGPDLSLFPGSVKTETKLHFKMNLKIVLSFVGLVAIFLLITLIRSKKHSQIIQYLQFVFCLFFVWCSFVLLSAVDATCCWFNYCAT